MVNKLQVRKKATIAQQQQTKTLTCESLAGTRLTLYNRQDLQYKNKRKRIKEKKEKQKEKKRKKRKKEERERE